MDLICKELGKRYGLSWIFKGFDFEFQSGNYYAITGPNGSGKSTLLQVLAGNVLPSRGTIEYQSDHQITPDYKIFREVSICTPYLELIEEFSLKEMLDFHFAFKSLQQGVSKEAIPEILLLEKDKNKYLKHYSSGMKQRAKLGLAILSDTPLLFLDEPGSNLDEKSFQWYQDLLQKYSKNRTVFIASNQKEEYQGLVKSIIDITQFKPQ